MVNFKEIYHFSRFQKGSNIFQGVQLFPGGGSNCLFPIDTHITCDFPGGTDPLPPPLDPHLTLIPKVPFLTEFYMPLQFLLYTINDF